MRFVADHDFHIHSTVSPCCHDENQVPLNILRCAEENGFKTICLTNHLWDENVKSEAEWHEKQRLSCLESVLPLPQSDKVKFLFGAEADMDYNFVLGISEKALKAMDFVAIPTTHMHLAGHTVREKIRTPEEAAKIWLVRLKELLKKDLPWHKLGIAHLTSSHIMKNHNCEVVALLKDADLYQVFSDCSEKGVGIELNIKTLSLSDEERKILLRPFYIAKDCGCKFYLGSDSHNVEALKNSKSNFENIITLLDLKENDKFILR